MSTTPKRRGETSEILQVEHYLREGLMIFIPKSAKSNYSPNTKNYQQLDYGEGERMNVSKIAASCDNDLALMRDVLAPQTLTPSCTDSTQLPFKRKALQGNNTWGSPSSSITLLKNLLIIAILLPFIPLDHDCLGPTSICRIVLCTVRGHTMNF